MAYHIDTFTHDQGLSQGDLVVLVNDETRPFVPYLVYMGELYGGPVYVTNSDRGILVIDRQNIRSLQAYLRVKGKGAFVGTPDLRQGLVARLWQRKDLSSFQAILAQNEIFRQKSDNSSAEVTQFGGLGIAGVGLAIAASSKSEEGKFLGILLALLGGAITLSAEADNTEKKQATKVLRK